MDHLSTLEKHMFWDRFLKYIEDRVNIQSFNTWFKPLSIVELTTDSIVIAVPKPYFSSWLEEHYLPLLKQSALSLLSRDMRFLFVIHDHEDVLEESSANNDQQQTDQTVKKPLFFEQQTVNGRFNFDSFVVGNSNQFAYAASKAVAEAPGNTAFNPLVIYSGVGLGKTHILQSIANHVISSGKFPGGRSRVIYVSSEKFTMDFIMSIQNNLINEYSTYYRSADVLLVDDIQFFNNKERTEEEFFHIFNSLHQNGKQIVLTMDRPPSQLKGLTDRLINRFQWGLVTDIQPPDYETRMAILKKKAESDGVYLDNTITDYIAKHITSNIRELEGALIRLLAYASLHGQDISLDMAQNVLGETFRKKQKLITIEYLQNLVAEHFSISDDVIISDSRRKEVAVARHIAIYLCKQLTDSSLKTIGLHFGGRDHSTVIHSIRTVESKYLKDTTLSRHVTSLIEKAKR